MVFVGLRQLAIGLSPPTRGNREPREVSRENRRSIPAHAGEPFSPGVKDVKLAVYPRPRGGTAVPSRRQALSSGLSPPTRGNPYSRWSGRRGGRSIPAHAGEPAIGVGDGTLSAVYPRPRGGTPSVNPQPAPVQGLSPPTRGNPHAIHYEVTAVGSIPAHAGEPPRRRLTLSRIRVYPRPRGGTCAASSIVFADRGLSPPTRGNPRPRGQARASSRSIPAHAGEPIRTNTRTARRSVYPRPRGGTYYRRFKQQSVTGLSPPTRGNPRFRVAARPKQGSIPAHAGGSPTPARAQSLTTSN